MNEEPQSFTAAIRAARRLVQGKHLAEGFARYEGILASARTEGNLDHMVQTLLDYGVELVAHGRVDEGADKINEAAYLAIDRNLADRFGDLWLAYGELCSARQEHADAIEWFLQAARQFRATDRAWEFALALSHYATEVDAVGTPRDAAHAHRQAAEAAQLIEGMPAPAMRLMAMHCECVARWHREDNQPTVALGAFQEARDYWQLAGADFDVARCDVVIGSLYFKLDCTDAAKLHLRNALRTYRSGGDVAAAGRIADVLRSIDHRDRDAGPDFS